MKNRSTDTAVLVRCTKEELETIKRACAILTAEIPGARIATYRFCLDAALKKAREIAEGREAEE